MIYVGLITMYAGIYGHLLVNYATDGDKISNSKDPKTLEFTRKISNLTILAGVNVMVLAIFLRSVGW